MFYQYYESPVGLLMLTSDGEALTGLSFAPDRILEVADLPIFHDSRKQLDEYFGGTRRQFELPLNNAGTPFQQRVWEALDAISYGTSMTYKELAISLGDLKAIRAVGTANGKNNIAIIVPCHRVIGTDGSLTGYAWGVDKKEWLLRHEKHPAYLDEQLSMF